MLNAFTTIDAHMQQNAPHAGLVINMVQYCLIGGNVDRLA